MSKESTKLATSLGWEKGVDFPEWGLTEVYLKTISKGYLLAGETPKDAYWRVATKVAQRLGKPDMASKFFDYIWRGWLCLASPVLSNTGTDRGLPISCFGIDVADSIFDIGAKNLEMMLLAKHGGGVGIGINQIRPAGSIITGNGTSDGVIPFTKIYDSTILATNQGSVRRGAASVNLNIDHDDFEEWLEIREPKGDVNRQSLNLHQAAIVGDKFMRRLQDGEPEARRRWGKLLQKRKATGEPYIMFKGNVNKQNPPMYKENGLKVHMTNICCLPGDTLVSTTKGPIAISELVDDTVYIFDGKNWVKNSGFEFKGYDKIYEITLSSGEVVRSNSNHRWFVNRNYNAIRRDVLLEKTTIDLNIGDFIEYHKEETHGDVHLDGAYIKGFIVGDGTQHGGKPILNVHHPKYSCEETLLNSLSEVNVDKGLRSDCIITPIFSDEVVVNDSDSFGKQEFKRVKGLTARKSLIPYALEYKKGIPEEVWTSWDRDSKVKFLSGLFDADGTVGKTLQWSDKNKQLVKTVQNILSTLGIHSSADLNYGRLSLNVQDTISFLNEGGCQRLRFEGKEPNRNTTGWRRIVSIAETDSVEEVYCTTVETTGKFALANGLMTGNSEITLHTDESHSFVCCLSSLNLAKYDEWKDTDLVYTATWFLDGVMSEFIQKAKGLRGFENAIRSAEKGRALGLGVLGWHTYLQQNGIPFEGLTAQFETRKIFSQMKIESERASRAMAESLGEPLWCRDSGFRNTHLRAIAPTVSNSKLSGNVSAGIEPWAANVFTEQSAKGTFIRKNQELTKVLRKIGINTRETWDKILQDGGSVQDISELDNWCFLDGRVVKREDVPEDQEHKIFGIKSVFKTFKEINQLELVKQAGVRQQYVDQAVSLNLAFPSEATPKWINQVTMEAWKAGIKTLYYMRTESVLRGDLATAAMDPLCESCDG